MAAADINDAACKGASFAGFWLWQKQRQVYWPQKASA